jgi:hypothetical protein
VIDVVEVETADTLAGASGGVGSVVLSLQAATAPTSSAAPVSAYR